MLPQRDNQSGLTLIETLVASAIFVVFSIALYQLYTTVFSLSGKIRIRTMLTEIAGEQFELIRNLPYASVGTQGGIPAGTVPEAQSISRNGMTFDVETTIRSIDDPADGTIGGTPNDLSPADKKLVELEVSCTSCKDTTPIAYTSVVAPKNLETENGNGALVIRAIDASGLPVENATVQIVNTSVLPAINSSDETGATGTLTIVDAPPSTQNYAITVSKNGYSTDRTYLPGGAGNPNPLKPHFTVAANTITQGTFIIDRNASFDIVTQSPQCMAIGNISGTLKGTKLVGTSPDVIKHTIPFATDSSGHDPVGGIEWDTYSLSIAGGGYDIVGTNPIAPLVVLPGIDQDLTVTLAPNNPNRLVIGVVDSSGLPLAGASVEIDGPSGTFDDITNIGSVSQTDWSGGGGQTTMTDWTMFDSGNNLDTAAGALSLANIGSYLSSGELTSSVIDLGDAATFHQLSWLPLSQPAAAGANSIRFQIATAMTNDDFTVWNYLGPDGTAATYYTGSPATISAAHDGARYARYKVFFSTDDTSVTPTLTDVSFTYTAGCFPPGQVDFGGLANGTYHITVSKNGFQTTEKDITINADIYDAITLTP